MTLREIFRLLSRAARQTSSVRFPLHVNLRDHQGQDDPVEVIERHARRLGYPNPTQLVRAWRAGYTHLLLDGFDEIATLGWQGRTKDLAQIRRRSVTAVRKFIQESPPGTGIVVAGREHFFGSRTEMLTSLDAAVGFRLVRMTDFSSDEIEEFLSALGWTRQVPDWVPARPLLLAYLARRGLLQEILEESTGTPPAVAWDELLDRICEREAQIEAGIDASAVRRIIERLATFARRSSSGVGPVFFDDIERAFREVVGYPPDEAAMVLLQRLPGLGAPDQQDQSSRFVDEQLVDAARAGDVVGLVENPYLDEFDDREWTQLLGSLGIEVAALRIAKHDYCRDNLSVAVSRLATSAEPHSALNADLIRVMMEVGEGQRIKDPVYIENVVVPEFRWPGEGVDVSKASFRDCILEQVELPADSTGDDAIPFFERCAIGSLYGRSSERDLPPGRFVECEVEQFSDSNLTTGSIMASSLPKGVRVMLTVLKKLYRQRGSGRKESALTRGLDLADRPLVGPVLDILEREGLAVVSRAGSHRVWAPVRRSGPRAATLLDSPVNAAADPAYQAAVRLSE